MPPSCDVGIDADAAVAPPLLCIERFDVDDSCFAFVLGFIFVVDDDVAFCCCCCCPTKSIKYHKLTYNPTNTPVTVLFVLDAVGDAVGVERQPNNDHDECCCCCGVVNGGCTFVVAGVVVVAAFVESLCESLVVVYKYINK
jgi:hypothetical protein